MEKRPINKQNIIIEKKVIEGEKEFIEKMLSCTIQKIKDFSNLSDIERYEIIKKANFLYSMYNKRTSNDYYRLLYYIYSLKADWRSMIIKNEAKIALIIETIDPTFEIYNTYKSIDDKEKAKIIILKIFGFFDPNLINLEKLYIERFGNNDTYTLKNKLEN